MSGLAGIHFDAPPVVEVVFGVKFRCDPPLMAAHIGLFWQKVRGEFPVLRQAPSLVTDDESYNFYDQLPLPRSWFVSGDGDQLLQLQGDLFCYNWKKPDENSNYPRFIRNMPAFEAHFLKFCSFIREECGGKVHIDGYELSYINFIDENNGLNNYSAGSALVDHQRAGSDSRFLPPPSSVEWNSEYLLPERQGRLTVAVQTSKRKDNGKPLLRIDMIAKGVPDDDSAAARQKWFGVAHNWITHGFADITVPGLHAIWGRRSDVV